MTIYRKSSKGKPWSAIRVERPLPEELKGLFSNVGQKSQNSLDNPDVLMKHTKIPGADKVVDFDTLTDDDEETARQIQKEILKESQDRSQRPKKLVRRSKGTTLSRVQVIEILNHAIEKFVKSWEAKQAKHPSNVQRKAWRLWQRILRQGSKDAFINELTENILHLGSRLQKIRDKIAQSDWYLEKDLIKQAQSMQPTVVEQATAKWQREVLQCLTAPEKPPPAEPKKPKLAKQALAGSNKKLRRYLWGRNAEEDDDASDSSHMSDFVVDDEVNVAEAQTAPKSPLMGAGVVNQKVNPNWPVFTGKGPLRPLFPNWGKKSKLMTELEAAEPKAAEVKTTEQKAAEEKTTEQKAPEEETALQKAEGETAPDSSIKDTPDCLTSAEADPQANSLKRGNTSPHHQNKKQKLDTVFRTADILDLTRSGSSEAQHALSNYDPDLLPAYHEVDLVGLLRALSPPHVMEVRDTRERIS